MKRLLGAALVTALLIPIGPANAEILKNLKVDGQLDIQANSANNITDFATRKDAAGSAALCGVATPCSNNDRISDAATRLLLNVSWDLLDDVHAVVTLRKNDRAWGTGGFGGQGAAAVNGGTGNQAIGAGGVQANTFVNQAYVKVDKVFGHVDTTLGRQYYGDAGDLIIYYGPKNNYGLTVEAIDAARFDMSNDMVNFSGLAGKVVGSAIGGLGATATDVTGFDIGVKNLPVKTDVFVWQREIHAVGASGTPPANGAASGLNDFLYVYGLKLHGEAMGGWANATVAANMGQDRSTLANPAVCPTAGCNALSSAYTGRALLADIGYKAEIANVGGFTPWASFGVGSGRGSNLENRNEGFTSIASDFRPGIINGRFNPAAAVNLGGAYATPVGTNGLNNRVVWGGGLKFKPSAVEKLTLAASIWDFRLQRNTFTNAAPGAGIAPNGNKHIGTEYGVTADWKHSENVNIGVGVANFQPGGGTEGLVAATGVGRGASPANLAFADFTLKF